MLNKSKIYLYVQTYKKMLNKSITKNTYSKGRKRIKISFFGSVRTDWEHVPRLINRIESILWFAPKEIIPIDDFSREIYVEHA